MNAKYTFSLSNGTNIVDFGTKQEVFQQLKVVQQEHPELYFYHEFIQFLSTLSKERFNKAPNQFASFLQGIDEIRVMDPKKLYDTCRSIYDEGGDLFSLEKIQQQSIQQQLAPFYTVRQLYRPTLLRMQKKLDPFLPRVLLQTIVEYAIEEIPSSTHQLIAILHSLDPSFRKLEICFLLSTLDAVSFEFVWERLCCIFLHSFGNI